MRFLSPRTFGLALALAVPLAAGAQPVTLRVDCASGRSINRALRFAPEDRPLVLQIRGFCTENVSVTRDDVTLRGSDPALDGVRARSSEPGHAAVTVNDARGFVLERLTLARGFVGLSVNRGAAARVSRARLAENRSLGLEVRSGATATLEDSAIEDNQYGALVVSGLTSAATCRRCTITSTLDPDGMVTDAAFVSGTLYLQNSTISGPNALDLDGGASVGALDTAVTGKLLVLNGDANLNGGTLDGSFSVDGGKLGLYGVVQTAGTGNRVTNRGYAVFQRRGTVDTSVPRTTTFARFSNAAIQGATLGDLVCTSGADVWCDPGTPVATSSCGLCPAP